MYVYILFFLSPEILNLLNTQTIMCCDVLLVLTVCLLRRLPRQVLLLVSLPAVMTVYSDILPVPQLCAIFTDIIEGIPSDMPDKVQHRKLKCLRDVISSPLFEPKGTCFCWSTGCCSLVSQVLCARSATCTCTSRRLGYRPLVHVTLFVSQNARKYYCRCVSARSSRTLKVTKRSGSALKFLVTFS